MHEPQARPRVFYEAKVEEHAPALYSFDAKEPGLPADARAAATTVGRFAEDGYVLLKGLLAPEIVERGRAALDRMTTSDHPDCEMIWFEGAIRDLVDVEDGRARSHDGDDSFKFHTGHEASVLPRVPPRRRQSFVRKLMGFVEHDPALAAIAGHADLLAFVETLVRGRPVLFQDMALIKPPRGREKPWHQDHAYFNLALDTPIVGVWIPFEHATPENGCMHVIKGGHRQGPRIHFKRRDWQICDTDVPTGGRVAVPMAPGDVLVFDGKLPHGTPINRTDQIRWAVQFHYRPADASEVADADRLAAFGSEGKDVTC